ncbi:zinc-ribbon domain-containing protein [Myxococcota bacterium]|nr:zinc-ribbon domain-containing protein [Myxococcota bacterium]MBU1899353.1 zinc-ribbon domain-containing protein [Myxococcota bacterium]
MDVRCEQCGTEYEFDESKVKEEGITVKCTHCGHLFRVVRQVALLPQPSALPLPPPDAGFEWRLRNGRGEIIPFRDLVTLQEWIVQGKVSPSDEISKTGENWKPLGSIGELSSFFVSARAPQPSPMMRTDGFNVGGFMGPQGGGPSWADHSFDTGMLRVGPEPTPGPFQTGHMLAHGPLNTQVSGVFPLPPHLSYSGIPAAPPPRGRAVLGFVLGVLVTLGLSAGGYFAYERLIRPPMRVEEAASPQDPRLLARLKAAEAAWRRDTMEGFAEAATSYTEVLTALGNPPADLRLAVEAHLGRARVALTQAEYAEGEAQRGTLEQAALELAQAERDPAAVAPQISQAQLLYADLYRLKGELSAAEEQLYKAKASAAEADEVAWRALALKRRRAGAEPTVEVAVEVAAGFAALSARARALPRVQYLWASALLEARDLTSAKAQISALNPAHPGAKALLARLEAAEAAQKKAQAEAAQEEAKKKAKAEPSEDSGGSFDSLMKRGNRDLENGNTGRARVAFQKASQKNPRNSEVWANLGWCELSDGKGVEALRFFDRALDKNSRFSDALYGKGKALESLGRKAQAIEAYKNYLDLHPRGSKAGMVRRRLERLAP